MHTPQPVNIEHYITESHPPPPGRLNRKYLNQIYKTLWGSRYRGKVNSKSYPHTDFIETIETSPRFCADTLHNSTGIVITTWNRPEYLQQCLQSLQRSNLSDSVVVIVDDASDDKQTLDLVRAFNTATPYIRIFKKKQTSMHVSLDIGWALLRNLGCKYLCNLDADTLVRTDWLTTLRSLFESVPYPRDSTLLSGFNRSNPPCILEEYEHYLRKYRMGGINYFFSPGFYHQIRFLLFNSNWDSHVQYYCGTQHVDRFHMICCKPSVVQHIGRVGLNAGQRCSFDSADDFVAN